LKVVKAMIIIKFSRFVAHVVASFCHTQLRIRADTHTHIHSVLLSTSHTFSLPHTLSRTISLARSLLLSPSLSPLLLLWCALSLPCSL